MQFSVVDDSLFIVAYVVSGGSEVGPCFVFEQFVSF